MLVFDQAPDDIAENQQMTNRAILPHASTTALAMAIVPYPVQPGGISVATGVTYQLFTNPKDVSLEGDPFGVGPQDNRARWWMETLTPTTATVEPAISIHLGRQLPL